MRYARRVERRGGTMHGRGLRPGLRTGRRPGSALLLVVIMTAAVAALAASAIYMSSSSAILVRQYDREREFRYAAEAALAIGKSRLSNDTTLVLADSGYTTLLSNYVIVGADGMPLPGVTVNLFAGRTGSTSGQFGRYASLVAEAHDASGSRFVRRLELAEDNFAHYLDWSNTTAGGCYGKGEVLDGPVWSNADLTMCTGSLAGAAFRDDVATAGNIVNQASASFAKPPRVGQHPAVLPGVARLASLPSYAAAANFSFTAPTTGAANGVRLRIEFVPVDLNNDGNATDADEGFFRVFQANAAAALRSDWSVHANQCGDWHRDTATASTPNPPLKFYPAAVHSSFWFRSWITTPSVAAANFGSVGAAWAHVTAMNRDSAVLSQPNARCYPAGDPHLVAVERQGVSGYGPADVDKGGEDTTFTPAPNTGQWVRWPGAVPAPLAALSTRQDVAKPYLFPLYRGYNPGAKGVIYVNGTVGVSGVLRGRVTLYAANTVVLLDDLTYATDPASLQCADMLGIIAGNDVVIADNALNTPQLLPGSSGGQYVFLDGNRDFYLHGVVMALNQSFYPENVSTGPTNATTCGGQPIGRGCLYQTGGTISQNRQATTTASGTGFLEQRSYDRCLVKSSPPYFPTTGHFLENRYYELDPARFNPDTLFRHLTTSGQ